MAEVSDMISSTTMDDSNLIPRWAQATLAHGADLGAKLLTYQQHAAKVKIINEAAGLISAQNIDVGQRMENFVNFHQTNSTVIPDHCLLERCGVPIDNLTKIVGEMAPPDVDKLQKNMLQAMNDLRQQMANEFVLKSAAVSAALIVVQIVKLVNVWKELKAAKNLHDDETKFLEIEQNIIEFQDMCLRLNRAIENKQTNKIVIQTMQLSTKYSDTMQIISNLKVKIDGFMQRLDLIGDGQIYDGLSNTIMVASNLIQLVPLFINLSTAVTIVSGSIIGLFAGLVIANGVTYKLTQKRLDELRADYKKLYQYELQFKKMNSEIQKVLKEQEDNI
jgi:hypothetical protein